MKTVSVTMELPVIEGYKYTGEYRKVRREESFLFMSDDTQPTHSINGKPYGNCYHILKKVKTWRKVNCLEDIGKKARFREHDEDLDGIGEWRDEGTTLFSISKTGYKCSEGQHWIFCEVLED